MTRWTFEPGHTAAEFCVRHMMITYVRGHFKNIHGTLEFDAAQSTLSRVEAVIETRELWTGDPSRDVHLKSADFLDVEHFPQIRFVGTQVRLRGPNDGVVLGDLTIRGVTRPVEMEVHYLGQWQTPWWEDGVNRGPKTRAGFSAQHGSIVTTLASAGTIPSIGAGWSWGTMSSSRSMRRLSSRHSRGTCPGALGP